MATLTQGTVSITHPDHIHIPPEAGKLSAEQIAALEKPRRGLGLACEKTAEAMKKYPDRLTVKDVDPVELARDGRAAEDIDTVISDVEALLLRLKQANNLLDEKAHRELRKVLAYVRGQEKFDRGIVDLVPILVAYFSNTRGRKESE